MIFLFEIRSCSFRLAPGDPFAGFFLSQPAPWFQQAAASDFPAAI
jgi:hypothetical protein